MAQADAPTFKSRGHGNNLDGKSFLFILLIFTPEEEQR